MSCLGNSYLGIGLSELHHLSEATQMNNYVSGSEAYSVILRQRQQKYTFMNFSQEANSCSEKWLQKVGPPSA